MRIKSNKSLYILKPIKPVFYIHFLLIFLLLGTVSFGNTGLITVDYSSSLGVLDPSLFGTIIRGDNTDTAFSLLSSAQFGIGEIMFQEDSPMNPNDPSQYDFSSRDSVFAQMYKNGIEPLVSFNLFSPPMSYSNYSIYIQNILRHYTQGWNNGFYYPLEYIRFGNEPDGGINFWSGTQSQFFRTYRTFAHSAKNVNPNFIIQGPGLRFAINSTSPTPAATPRPGSRRAST